MENKKQFLNDKGTPSPFLYPHQRQAIDRMFTGCILNGNVGSGKSRTGLFYYFKENGGWIENGEYTPMKIPKISISLLLQ